MVERVIDVRRDIAAPPSTVWAILADSAAYASWGIWDESWLERPGYVERDGVGAVRIVKRGSRTLREEITEFAPGQVLGYRVISGLPVRSYRALVTLQPSGAGTQLRWQATIESARGLAELVRRALRPVIEEVAWRLSRQAETEAGAVVFRPVLRTPALGPLRRAADRPTVRS